MRAKDRRRRAPREAPAAATATANRSSVRTRVASSADMLRCRFSPCSCWRRFSLLLRRRHFARHYAAAFRFC
jgi:hypothetical protein